MSPSWGPLRRHSHNSDVVTGRRSPLGVQCQEQKMMLKQQQARDHRSRSRWGWAETLGLPVPALHGHSAHDQEAGLMPQPP